MNIIDNLEFYDSYDANNKEKPLRGIIYRIFPKESDDDSLSYYGSTISTLENRRIRHKSQYMDWLEGKLRYARNFLLYSTFGYDECDIEILLIVNVKDFNELETIYENDYINNNPNINIYKKNKYINLL